MNERCLYCGRTKEVLYLEFPNEQSPFCSCCNHCVECKLLTSHHKYDKKPDKPYKYADSPYTHLYDRRD